MPRGIADASNLLWVEGQSVVLDFTRTSPSTGKLTWTIPANAKVYDGILITGSLIEINPSNYPTDGVRYTGSTDFSAPADKIGKANIMVALYDDRTTVEAEISGLDQDAVYYFSAHVVSNVRTYYTIGVVSYPRSLTSEQYAGDIPKKTAPPTNPVVGQAYFDEVQQMIFFWDGAAWIPTRAHTVLTGEYDPEPPLPPPSSFPPGNPPPYPEGYPMVGDFFYNTRERDLKIWDGDSWNSVETENNGVPMYAKRGVGTDQSYDERLNLMDVLRKQLGYPKVCVELIEDHYNIAIDNALEELRHRADHAYWKQYFFMSILPDQQVYYLNDPSVGTNQVADVLKIWRINTLGIVNWGPDYAYAQAFLNQFYAPGIGYDLVSVHLIQSLSETHQQLFAGEVAYTWREAQRELRIHRRFTRPEKVLVEVAMEKTEQELLLDRWVKQWIQQWAEAELMFMLAKIRGKYASLPGPGGNLALNAAELATEAQRLQEDCLRQITDQEIGQNGSDGFGNTSFVIG